MSRRWAATTRRSAPACCRDGARSCAAWRPTRRRSAASSRASGRPRAGAQVTHEIVKKLNTTLITPIDREDIHDLATRLDDVLDYIEAAAERLVVYRIKEPTSACRAMADVIVKTTEAMDRAIRCLRNMDPGFHEHAVEVNRLENSADNLLRDSLAALFDEQGDPIEVIKWKEIYETMEIVTDRCEDVANVIEGIILKMA